MGSPGYSSPAWPLISLGLELGPKSRPAAGQKDAVGPWADGPNRLTNLMRFMYACIPEYDETGSDVP